MAPAMSQKRRYSAEKMTSVSKIGNFPARLFKKRNRDSFMRICYLLGCVNFSKFLNNIATVIGPMPPGTGVNRDAFSAQVGSMSPFNVPPCSEVPASRSTAPFFIMSGFMK